MSKDSQDHYDYHQRPETSHRISHPVEDDSEIHLPLILINEFQRLASSVHIDYYDFQQLLGLTSEGSQDISSSNLGYFMNEIIRKIERYQSQPGGGGGDGGGGYDYDEEEAAKKKKKNQIKKQEEKLLNKVNQLDEEIQFNITKMNQQNHQIEKPLKIEKESQQKLMKNLYREKQQKHILEEFIESQNKKIKVLIAHIEKLVKSLKVESNKKIKIAEEYQAARKEVLQLKEKIEKQNLIHATQSRAIEELREGSKVLEDQLKLMDEKFLELRSKLDVSRNFFQEKMKKVQKECTDLRFKYSVATNGGSLDHVKTDGYSKKGGGGEQQHLSVTIQSEPAYYSTQTMTPFQNERRGSSPKDSRNGNGNVSPNQEGRKSVQLSNGVNFDRRGSSPPPSHLDPQRESSSFQDIKKLPNSSNRPQSALDNSSPDPSMRRHGPENRPKSAFTGNNSISNHPSLTSSRISKEKQASLIIRRIKSRSSGGKENWTAERIFELLDG